jgi:hypothetical protein
VADSQTYPGNHSRVASGVRIWSVWSARLTFVVYIRSEEVRSREK